MFVSIWTLSLASLVWSLDPVIEDLKTPLKELGEYCGYDSCPFVKEGMLNVHIVPHTHAEYGFRRTFPEYYSGRFQFGSGNYVRISNMKRILDYTITELWAKQDRKFTLSDTPYLFHWWANRDGTVRRMVYQLLRSGRLFIVGGGWGMVDEACTSYHGIIDQFTHALRKLNGTFGACGRPLVAWQSDVYGHSKEFASLAAQLAFDGLFVNPISFDDEILRMQSKQMEMVWRGSDDLGQRTNIFTHKLFDGYWSPPGFCFGHDCNDSLLITSDSLFNNVKERVDVFIDSMKTRQSPHYLTNNVMVIMGMRMAYYDASVWFRNIDTLIQNVNARSAEQGHKIHLMYSTPACYLRAVYESNPSLPIKQDDFMAVAYNQRTHLTGYYTSRPTVKYMVREGHVYFQMAKQMQILANLGNNNKLFEDINWAMGTMQDHNVITGSMMDYVKDYYTNKMYHAVQKSTLILKQAFNKLRKSPSYTIYYRCSFNESSCRNLNDVRSFIVIYNPLAWSVSMPIRIPIKRANTRFTVYDPKLRTVKSVMMKIPDAVRAIPARNTTADHEIVFMADNLPPMGYRSYFIESDSLLELKKRRSIIKMLNKNIKKKYITRQTDQLRIDDKSLLDDYDNDYYHEEVTTVASEVAQEDFNEFHRPPEMRAREETDVVRGGDTIESKIHRTTFTTATSSTTARTTTSPTSTTTTTGDRTTLSPEDDSEYDQVYYYHHSTDSFIGNKFITVNLDKSNQPTSVKLSNGVRIALKIGLYFYASDEPIKFGREEAEPSSIIFKPMDTTPEIILEKKLFKSSVFKTYMVEETHTRFASWASLILRVYQDRPVIEVDWVVGPIPNQDAIGKDVFIRYATDLDNEDFFYTDSNGRQTVKRMKNDRPTYEPVYPTAVPGNYYPVTSKIYIQDTKKNIRFSVFNDRAQGGTSLNMGQIDLMIHRRIFTNENYMHLNETENGLGITVRGKHYLYISKADFKPNRIFEKKFAKEIELAPQVLAGPYKAYGENSKEIWFGHINEYSGINRKIPVGVHVLTLQEWNGGTLLLRLENYLEKSDTPKSGYKTVFIQDLFTNLEIRSARETTLGGNVWLEDHRRLHWTTKDRFAKSFNDYYRGNGSVEYSDDSEQDYEFEEFDLAKGIKLTPQQIRTFIVVYDYHM